MLAELHLLLAFTDTAIGARGRCVCAGIASCQQARDAGRCYDSFMKVGACTLQPATIICVDGESEMLVAASHYLAGVCSIL